MPRRMPQVPFTDNRFPPNPGDAAEPPENQATPAWPGPFLRSLDNTPLRPLTHPAGLAVSRATAKPGE
jgi:hypothetical protein